METKDKHFHAFRPKWPDLLEGISEPKNSNLY